MTVTVFPPLNIIPNLPPIHQEIAQRIKRPDGEYLHMHPAWHQFFSQLTTALQTNFSQEGVSIPKQSTNNINLLTQTKSVGSFLYDSTTDQMKVNLNVAGVPTWKIVTTS